MKRVLALILFMSAFHMQAYASDLKAFPYFKKLGTTDTSLAEIASVELSPDIYDKSDGRLETLRLLDET